MAARRDDCGSVGFPNTVDRAGGLEEVVMALRHEPSKLRGLLWVALQSCLH
jgi:hypothetical protein